MKYVQISATATAWAKSIILGKHRQLLEEGNESYFFWGRKGGKEDEQCRRFATDLDNYMDGLLTRIDGRPGFHSRRATKRLLGWLDEIDPDVVHLHNLLGYYVNVELLFDWLAKHRCKVIWTIHDCWAFTGHCIYFTYANCTQWKDGCATCARCPQKRTYPQTLAGDSSVRWSYEQKKRLFTMLSPERMRLITPSQWLADLVKQSYLSKYEVTVVHNTVDTSVFRPTPSDFRERYGIGDRFMVLGVANPWSERKGLGDFVRLAGELDLGRFVVVLVGLSRRQIREVRDKVLALPRVESATELAEAYLVADVVDHSGVEETYRVTDAEACAYGVPVVDAEGSAYVEAAIPGMAAAVRADMSTLKATVVNLGGGGLIVLVERTESAMQLAAIYTTADVFFNPTREDNYPTVNLEAEACGTQVLTYDVGGATETIRRPDSASVDGLEGALSQLLYRAGQRARA